MPCKSAVESALDAPAWIRQLVDAALTADQSTQEPAQEWQQPPVDGSARPAAVLIALCDTPDGPGVLLTERAMTLRSHAGQAAFPGGGVEPNDRDAVATALREAAEEVGLDPSTVCPLASMPDRYIPPSNFLVTPVVAWWVNPHPIAAIDEGEVARAVVVTIGELANPANRFSVVRRSDGRSSVGFDIDGLFIWGFTAMVIDDLLRLGNWERPWDHAKVRPVPERRTW